MAVWLCNRWKRPGLGWTERADATIAHFDEHGAKQIRNAGAFNIEIFRARIEAIPATYAILVVSTPLCSIVGVNEVMTLTADALNAEPRHDLLIPMYLYVLAWFFIYCFPIARWTVFLERRFAQER